MFVSTTAENVDAVEELVYLVPHALFLLFTVCCGVVCSVGVRRGGVAVAVGAGDGVAVGGAVGVCVQGVGVVHYVVVAVSSRRQARRGAGIVGCIAHRVICIVRVYMTIVHITTVDSISVAAIAIVVSVVIVTVAAVCDAVEKLVVSFVLEVYTYHLVAWRLHRYSRYFSTNVKVAIMSQCGVVVVIIIVRQYSIPTGVVFGTNWVVRGDLWGQNVLADHSGLNCLAVELVRLQWTVPSALFLHIGEV